MMDPIPLADYTVSEVVRAETEGEGFRVHLRDPATDDFSYFITPAADVTIDGPRWVMRKPVPEIVDWINATLAAGSTLQLKAEFGGDGSLITKAHFERTNGK